MIDPWKSMLDTLVQDYDKLYAILNDSPKISITLDKKEKFYWITISDNTINTLSEIYKNSSVIPELEERLIWTTNQLLNWKDVSRQTYNQWKFSKKLDAEKFITLFNLTWA